MALLIAQEVVSQAFDATSAWSPSLAVVSSLVGAALLALCLPICVLHTKRRLKCLRQRYAKRGIERKKQICEEPAAPVVTKELDFPQDWWMSQRLFDLEKRAIFSKTWLHVTHTSLFKKPGDFRTFSIADFGFIVILGKDRRLRAFHNVCRHRAYNVTNRSCGSSQILRCKYHGWTYDSTGKLVHAPKFEEVAGFNKAENGLFEIRCWSDSSGFVYVNFDVYGSDGLTIRVGVPMRAKLRLLDSWKTEATFNWKMAIPNGSFRIRSLASKPRIQDLLGSFASSLISWRWPTEFELSPLTKLLRSANGHLFLTISVIPTAPEACDLICHLYSSRPDQAIEFSIDAMKAEVMESIRTLQASFDQVKHVGDIPDPASQEPLLAEIHAHTRLERLMGSEVFPASRLRETSKACQVADDLCKELEAAAGQDGEAQAFTRLAW